MSLKNIIDSILIIFLGISAFMYGYEKGCADTIEKFLDDKFKKLTKNKEKS